jgi:riboflavin synthase
MRALFDFNKNKPEKGSFSRFLWVYSPSPYTAPITDTLKHLKIKRNSSAINSALLGRLELDAQRAGYRFGYATIKEPSLLCDARLREAKSRVLWIVPSINDFSEKSQEAAYRTIEASPKQRQLFVAMEPMFSYARHLDDYNAIAWYLLTRESLERLLEQPLSVVPISRGHPHSTQCIKQALHDTVSPRGCAPVVRTNALNLHPLIKSQIIDLLASVQQLASEVMTHSRIRAAVMHTREKAKQNVLAILSAKHKKQHENNNSALFPQGASQHKNSAFCSYPSIDTYA